jgi:CheY-like chemotaxis protein
MSSLPTLLCVDDSDAILALERAILSGHYQLTTASNGLEALDKLAQAKPAAVLLDLSMPRMDGDEVLARMRADSSLKDIPVVLISSEQSRAEGLLQAGADAFLSKPFRADELLATVERVLTRAREKAREGGLAVLLVGVGEVEFALPLEAVRRVLLMPATLPLPAGPAYLSEYVEVEGEPVCVLDVARRLGLPHVAERVEQKLVVVAPGGGAPLALAVDGVKDPEEIPPADVTWRDQLGGSEHGPLREGLVAMVRTSQGASRPVLDPQVFVSRGLLRELPRLVGGGAGPEGERAA